MFKKRKAMLIIAAVLLLGIVLLVFFSVRKSWNPVYNRHDQCFLLASRMEPAGSMYETLTEEQLALVTPDEALRGMSFTNRCHYWVSGTKMQVYLLHFYVETARGESIRISMGEEAHDAACCIFYDADPKISKCGNVDYALYESESQKTYHRKLIAKAYINDVPVVVFMSDIENLNRAKRDFEKVLEWLSTYREGYPAISQLAPIDGPEDVINQTLNLEEAQNDPEFGKYMVRDVPEGLSARRLVRSKYDNKNDLYAYWLDGNRSLVWNAFVTDADDLQCLVPVRSDLYKQLCKYPPVNNGMAPEHLLKYISHPMYLVDELTLEMVQARAVPNYATDLHNIHFSVLIGNVAVVIKASGVEPEWIYGQIVQIRDNLE